MPGLLVWVVKQRHPCLTYVGWLLEFYILVTSEVISGWASTCDNVNSWRLHSAARLETQAANIMI